VAASPVDEPARPEPKLKRRRTHAPKPKPKEWWEEYARWRLRSAEEEADARRGRPMYRCLVDYDVLKDVKGYDPFD
jgi:hypothetical protein